MIIVIGFIFWLILCAVAGKIADQKGRSGWGYFIIAFFLSPLIGILLAAVLPTIQENLDKRKIRSGDSRTCPNCSETVKTGAKICKHCGRDLPPMPPRDPITGMSIQ